jgi:hypothetical protein
MIFEPYTIIYAVVKYPPNGLNTIQGVFSSISLADKYIDTIINNDNAKFFVEKYCIDMLTGNY